MVCPVACVIRAAGTIEESEALAAVSPAIDMENFITRVDSLIGDNLVKREDSALVWTAPAYLK